MIDWRRRFPVPFRIRGGLWMLWDRLTCQPVGPFLTREQACEARRRIG